MKIRNYRAYTTHSLTGAIEMYSELVRRLKRGESLDIRDHPGIRIRVDDVWLHTKNIPGSHVIIRQNLDDVSEEALYEAAKLAAYYSKARTSSQVPVDYAPRKNVKKPNGAKPGMVIYDDYGTVYVTPDEELVYRLMKNR